MSTLICGSIAYDTIMVFRDRFKNHILPDQLHILNVAFLVPDMRREFGGCAGNIAYSLRMLGGDPVIMATVGEDHDAYSRRLDKLGIDQKHIRRVDDTFTAQAFITTDLDDNQITAFHPGAMNFSHLNHVQDAVQEGREKQAPDGKDGREKRAAPGVNVGREKGAPGGNDGHDGQAAGGGVTLGIIAPDGRDGMLQHAREYRDAQVPFVFDPGQGLPMFNGEELIDFVELADYVTVNDYEAQMLQERTGRAVEDLAKLVKGFVVTLGARGSMVYTGGSALEIPCVKAPEIVDPTGCGDAFRAGLLYGIAAGMDWPTTGRLASLLGSIKIGQRGGQNHEFTRDEVAQRYRDSFGTRIW